MKLLSAILVLFGLDKLAIIFGMGEEDILKFDDMILNPKTILILLGIESVLEIICGAYIFFYD